MILELDRFERAGSNLGPDNAGFAAVWLHGCDRGCKGCVTALRNAAEPECYYAAEFLAELLLTGEQPIGGVVISGGEPIRQAEAAAELLHALDARTEQPLGVMLYTGYCYEELLEMAKSRPAVAELLHRIDILVDGPYVTALDDDKPYRGSANQRMFFLSGHYSAADFTQTARRAKMETDMRMMALSGIPGRDVKAIWSAIFDSDADTEEDEYDADRE